MIEPHEPGPGTAPPIVAVGASAGGLEAFTQLLMALPADTGMAFVLVQHLAPSHPSALAEILARATKMPVTEVLDESLVEPNHVYVIPPNRCMSISEGSLQLTPRELPGSGRVIDHFFRALAADRGYLAIGVVLSGTATDGTLGLEAIKAEGGICFAQDDSAQHEGMPSSAIASGCVDFVLPPAGIARELVRISQHPATLPMTGTAQNQQDFEPVVRLLRNATGVDFSHYKFNTFYRRVTRRVVLSKRAGLKEYVQLLLKDPAEVMALYQDILVNVTTFFRNPEAFAALKAEVFPRLIKAHSRHDPVRIWTVGCSTGQEAYSLAMAYAEVAGGLDSGVPLQLFATDLNGISLDKARAGLYAKDIAEDVSPERLRRFFVAVDGGYRISKTIRNQCVFSRHNVLSDPPFSRMDLISCRNLLIYLEPVLQQKILPALHYALKPEGCLWLGGSETIGTYRKLFETADAKHKIYTKKSAGLGSERVALDSGMQPRSVSSPIPARPADPVADLHKEADRLLLNRYAPAGVLVSAELDILQYRGDTSPFLAPAPGKASLSLLKMLREGLLVGVRGAIARADREGVAVREPGLRVKSGGVSREIAIEVVPVQQRDANGRGFLVLFDPADAARPAAAPAPPASAPAPVQEPSVLEADNLRLQQELAATRDYLQSVIEQHEAANEELQSANEEIQSANEELQSTNEELETSKEEIQSSNEELATVNDELNNRNAELNRVNNDLLNLLEGVATPIIMLGRDLRIRRFTPAAASLLNLIAADIGRPLADLKLNLNGLPELEPLLAEVLDTVSAKQYEVRDRHGHWYLLQLRTYRTQDNHIEGVVVLLVDVDVQKRAQEYAEGIVATVREPLLVLDADLRVQTASRAFYEDFMVSPEQILQHPLSEIDKGLWNIPALLRSLAEVLRDGGEFADFEVEHEFEHRGKRSMLLNARRLPQLGQKTPALLLAIEDITERNAVNQELRRNAEVMSEADLRKNEFLALLAHELRNPLAPISNAVQILLLADSDPKANRPVIEMMHNQVNHMVRLVDDLLDVSRISQGKIELRRQRVELASVVHHAVESVRSACKSKGIELVVSLPPQPVYLDGDPARLTQIIGNLLINACKFNDKSSGGSIQVVAERREEQVVIRIKDNGIGIAPDQQSRIFGLFVQSDTALERSHDGLGIGLALVKNLAEMHGGSVQIYSAGLGLGSEFTLRLPILPVLPETASIEAPKAASNSAPTSQVTPVVRRILVVDDNRASAQSLAKLLKLNGHEIHTAYDGLEAVNMAASVRPDVVLLDIGLPKINGYEVARKIREQPWGQNMSLIALTGWGQNDDKRRAKEAGFDHHVVKPVKHTELTALLASLPART